ncbi:hypothetical protein PHLCEN_2v9079 [Hermanssonia centrifuga]|uniref:WLM domain-containing protein n=1 Tax=Hermanssonia centrifuga TaxID=98765 RepID=A0A2R6NS40_9APHY|nr:hypothetical protein PHLCEN_2v9079 [Hermanssonia centrifuga]
MVNTRLNERVPNPNAHINFITATDDDGRELLRALAAQVRPVMATHAFTVNRLEEHSDHGPAFQALWAQLCKELKDLQAKGYYGDGYWSSGTRLVDSARISAQTLVQDDLPEYTCGGAHSRARPRKRRRTTTAGGSSSGRQTAKKRKAGVRVTRKDAFKGDGRALVSAAVDDDNKRGVGNGFGKRAASKRAREDRAVAAERRLLALQSEAGPSDTTGPIRPPTGSDDEGEEEEEDTAGPVLETDQERRKTMRECMSASDLHTARTSPSLADFLFPTTTTTNTSPLSSSSSSRLSYGNFVQSEVSDRKKEALGMVAGGRRLGSSSSSVAAASHSSSMPPEQAGTMSRLLDTDGGGDRETSTDVEGKWTCLICTLYVFSLFLLSSLLWLTRVLA